MRTKKYIFTIAAALTCIMSCKEDDLILSDPNVINPTIFYQNATELESSVNAAYSFLQNHGMYGRTIFYLYDNLAHENTATDALQGGLKSWLDYSFDASNEDTGFFWNAAYMGISSCNFVITSNEEGLIQNVGEDEIKQRVAEAHFLRAFYYFYLTNTFNGVPLLTTLSSDTAGTPKSTQEEVYALIIEDLEFAKANLPEKGNTDEGRATKGAAQALLGKTYLFLEKWAEAKAEFEDITGYTIVGVDPRDNGNVEGEFNSESIFEVQFSQEIGGSQWSTDGSGIRETTFRGVEYSPLNYANVIVRPTLFAQYEANDPRIKAYFYQAGDEFGGQRFPEGSELPINGPVQFGDPDENGTMALEFTIATPYWRKYSNLDNQLTDGSSLYSGINFRVIRYADVLLMWAEAENELGNSSIAIDLMNRVRDRVNMPNYGTPEMDSEGYPVGSKEEIFQALIHERQVELSGEQVRYFDLKRWGLLSQEILGVGFQVGKHEWMPIPQLEIDGNPQMSQADQNPEY